MPGKIESRTDIYEEFDELVEPLLDSLYGYARKLAGDTFIADQVVVDSLSKAARNFDKFEQGTNFTAWMRTIIRNTFISEIRRKKFDSVGDGDIEGAGGSVDTLSDNNPDPDYQSGYFGDDAEDDDIFSELPPGDDSPDHHTRLYYACQQLRPERREVMELRYAKQMKYREIADHLGIKTGSVMSRLSRAREDLKKILEQGSVPIIDITKSEPNRTRETLHQGLQKGVQEGLEG